MGDRTTVRITIRKSDYNNLEKEFGGKDKFEEEVGASEVDDLGDLIDLTAYEVNYANWDELESLLKDRKIEYNKSWDAGSEYDAGDSYVRILKGELREIEINNTQYEQEMVYKEILTQIKKGDIKKLEKFVLKRLKEIRPFEIVPLDQPNSVRFIQED